MRLNKIYLSAKVESDCDSSDNSLVCMSGDNFLLSPDFIFFV